MSDRLDFYYRQRVTEAELDLAFELLEKADRNLAADIGLHGIVSGAVPSQHAPVADLSIDLNAPAWAYDRLGQRIFFGTGQTVNLAVDSTGIPTEVPSATKERWLGVFLRFDRLLSDPRTDGNSQQVFFRRDESFEIVVRQAAPGPVGAAHKVALVEGELLVCDVKRRAGQMQILAADINVSRRQAFVFAQGTAVQVLAGLWKAISTAANTVQLALDSLDELLAGHFGGTSKRHKAEDVDCTPHEFVAANTVKGAIHEIIDDLSSTTDGSPGALRVGADTVTGTPHALAAGSVDGHLSQLLGFLNAHISKSTGAHAASAISAQQHLFVSSTNVQAQLQEIASDLQSQASSSPGASLVGNDAFSGTPYSLTIGSVRQHIRSILTKLNDHIASGDHDARYLREVYQFADKLIAGESRKVTTLDEFPHVVLTSYHYVNASGWPESSVYYHGQYSGNIRCWATKIDGTDKCEFWVQNTTSKELFIRVGAYQTG